MIQIFLLHDDGRRSPLDLNEGTRIQLEIFNPIFDDELTRTTFSFPFTIPLTPRNRKLLGFADVLYAHDTRQTPGQWNVDLYDAGVPQFRGVLKRRKVRPGTLECNFQAGENSLADQLKNLRLRDLTFEEGDLIFSEEPDSRYNQDEIKAAMKTMTQSFWPQSRVAFPTLYNYNFCDHPHYQGYINYYTADGQFQNSSSTVIQRDRQTPMPYTREVIAAIGRTMNWEFTGSGLVQSRVLLSILYSNYDWGFYNNTTEGSYNATEGRGAMIRYLKNRVGLGPLLPDLSAADFLNALRRYFFLAIFWDSLNRKAEILDLEALIENKNYEDWTERASPQFEAEEPEYREGFTLQVQQDSSDALARDLDFTGMNDKGVTQNIHTEARPEAELDYIFCQPEMKYYRGAWIEADTDYAWEYFGPASQDVVHGNGKTSWPLMADTLPMEKRADWQNPARSLLIPHADQPGRSDIRPERNEASLRFLLYWGMQPDSEGNLYPLASGGHWTYNGINAQNLYLALYQGIEQGPYAQRGSTYLACLEQARRVTYRVRLNHNELAQLDMKKKKRINHVNYLINKVSVTLPLTEEATIEFRTVP
ncbi:hypothetical protein SAMN05421823_102501 [Catalinimonas alkaloidigena]|uniref:Uncharacterized protein n=1 Tax=Catalinimonas alkaloidigena TaxID=1075417 RepID=A0A1G9B3K3_9BACT|nr:hypothetical protein [Catalinimonas alkaloidigena]SDK34097.1 hypothetical protein SAMN05421823_102501 [Catalinimonas alkaloidigena]